MTTIQQFPFNKTYTKQRLVFRQERQCGSVVSVLGIYGIESVKTGKTCLKKVKPNLFLRRCQKRSVRYELRSMIYRMTISKASE